MSASCFMGIDLGTSGARVGVYDASGQPLSKAEVAYDTMHPQAGWAEQCPADWWSALCKASRTVMEQLPAGTHIETVVVGATSSTVLMIDKHEQPIGNALLWMDSRAVAEAAAFNATGHQLLRYCGGEVSVEWMGPKSLWLQKHSADYAQAERIVEQLDYINFLLSGEWVASQCNATCKWNYVDKAGGFSQEFFAAAGFSGLHKWPSTVLPVGAPIAKVSKDAAAALHLPNQPLLLQGAIDAHLGMFGLGVVAPGTMAVIMGTSFVQLALTEKEIFTPGLWGPYPNAVVQGYNLLEGGQISAGANIRWFRDTLAQERTENAYASLTEEAARIAPGAENLLALDFWQGNRTPLKDPHLQGAFVGLRLHHTQGHMFRAMLESVGYGCRSVLESFAAGGGMVDALVACGGVVQNPLWMQIIADICGKSLHVPQDVDGVLLGGAVLGAVQAGVYQSYQEAVAGMVRLRSVFTPDISVASIYKQQYDMYQKTIRALTPIMHANV